MPKKKVVVRAEGEPEIPPTLQEAIVFFSDKDRVHAFAVEVRWPTGVFCPFCGGSEHGYIATRRLWKCKNKECRKQFSVRVGTIFEDSPISLSKWFTAMWMLTNCKNGVSSYEIARNLDVTQKTAWFMLHRIRAAIKAKTFDKKLSGIVETDESFIGGLFKNMHERKKQAIRDANTPKKRGGIGKTIVQAVLERDGEIRAQILETNHVERRLAFLLENVEEGSQLMTDEASDVPAIKEKFIHDFVNHEVEYVRGNVHCNGVENFWTLLQRSLGGTYISVEPFHLSAYVDEQAYRFNMRKRNDATRFVTALAQTAGVRLTYKDLIRAEQA
jgi:transposase-like protein